MTGTVQVGQALQSAAGEAAVTVVFQVRPAGHVGGGKKFLP
jgi:hypothetical protein